MPSKKTINVSEPIFKDFIKVKGELTAKFGMNLGDNFVMKALLLNWSGDSAEIEEEAQKLKALKTAEKVQQL